MKTITPINGTLFSTSLRGVSALTKLFSARKTHKIIPDLLIINTIIMLSASSPALAAGGMEAEGNGFLVILFLGFGALIIVFQLIPALMLFGSMIKGLFCKPAKTTVLAGGKTAKAK